MRKHVRLAGRAGTAVAAALVAGTVTSVTAAYATPPSGLVTWTDHARVKVHQGGTVKTPIGSGASISPYVLAPGAHSGWRTFAGSSVLAVSKGALTAVAAKGCTTREVKAGEGTVLPAGRYLIANTGTAPAEFVGAFVNLAPKAAGAVLDGAGERAPAGCAGVDGYAPREASVAAVAAAGKHGKFVSSGTYGHSQHAAMAGSFPVPDGTDVFVSTYRIEPGFSTGWYRHAPGFAVIGGGTLTYYEAHDGACTNSGKFSAGDAFVHSSPHDHLAINEGSEALDVTVVWTNLPHGGKSAIPVAGNQLDAFDFTPLVPVDCPRVR